MASPRGVISGARRRFHANNQPLRLSPADQALMRCPRCGGALTWKASKVTCGSHAFPIVAGVPVFTEAGTEVEVRPIDHASHQASTRIRDLFTGAQHWLHLGAGATGEVLPGSIELETAIFVHTHVVADVHHLPFADGVLGGVLALNVFEHLEDPELAARELHRVLSPGSVVLVQTAFLQPLHADPYHYYNTTEVGLRRWFRQFQIDAVEVPGNFNPLFAMSWMASELLYHSGGDDRATLGTTTLEELAQFWTGSHEPAGALFEAFDRLPDRAQRILAAGFEITARR